MSETAEPSPKILSVAEANALLPTIKPLIEQLQRLQRSIVETNTQLDDAVTKMSAGNGYPIASLKEQIHDMTKQQRKLLDAFQSILKQLEAVGCLLKDLNSGLIDFYSVRDHQPIFLCWKMGEDRIRFWHTLEAGYAGRQPLDVRSDA